MAIKLIIIIRKDLKMRRGKEIAQGGHSVDAWLLERLISMGERFSPDINGEYWYNLMLSKKEKEWMETGRTKITKQVNSEKELLEIKEKAEKLKINCHLITDSGATEFHGKATNTCLSLGPEEEEILDKIVKEIALY